MEADNGKELIFNFILAYTHNVGGRLAKLRQVRCPFDHHHVTLSHQLPWFSDATPKNLAKLQRSS